MSGLYPIIGRLRADGFSVVMESLFFKQRIPVWRIKVGRNGRLWIAFNGDLDEIFLELKKLTVLLHPPLTVPFAEPEAKALSNAKRRGKTNPPRMHEVFDRHLDPACRDN